MPGGDGTGPAGMGPMTGRAAGLCAGYATPGYMNPIAGRGFWGRGGWGGGGWGGRGGWGRGGGRGHRNWFYATGLTGWQRAAFGSPAYGAAPHAAPYYAAPAPAMAREQEIEALKGQAEYFEDALDGIKRRIEELGSKANEA